MTKQNEPAYRTAYRENGAHICPETGTDLTNYSADGVRAYAESLYPKDASGNFSDEAKERKAILLEIAKAKES